MKNAMQWVFGSISAELGAEAQPGLPRGGLRPRTPASLRRGIGARDRLDSFPIASIRRGTLILAATLLAGASAPAWQTPERASVSSSEIQGNDRSSVSSISGDGRYVAFDSYASNLVSYDTNGLSDVFIRDRTKGTTKGLTVLQWAPAGTYSSTSRNPEISKDGKYVAFESRSSNLVVGDTNGAFDIFVYSAVTNGITRVSVSSSGSQSNYHSHNPSISGDGRYVAFEGGLVGEIYVHDRQTGVTKVVSFSASGYYNSGFTPSISDDGRFVAFEWFLGQKIEVVNVATLQSQIVTVSSSGTAANNNSFQPSISGNGRHVAFWSLADNLVPGDTNYSADIFVHDTTLRTTERVSVDSLGIQANNSSQDPSISSDNRYVAFASEANNLVPGGGLSGLQIYVHDRKLDVTTRVSEPFPGTGNWGNDDSILPSISDGIYVAFASYATDLVPLDTNGVSDIFVGER